jgi:hypothetical protein
MVLAVKGLALAANMKSAKHAKRTVGFNILEKISSKRSLLESSIRKNLLKLLWEFPNSEKLFPKLGTRGEGWYPFKY